MLNSTSKDRGDGMRYSEVLKKWTLARNQNANYIDRLFLEDSTRVELLKNNAPDLVVLNRGYFEKLIDNQPQTEMEKFLERHFSVVESLVNLLEKNEAPTKIEGMGRYMETEKECTNCRGNNSNKAPCCICNGDGFINEPSTAAHEALAKIEGMGA